jgi:hypothetical protein
LEITRFTTAAPGRTRTVFPVPDLDPDFSVTLRELSDAEQARIYDKNNYMPGRKDATMQKLARITQDAIRQRVVDWSNFTENGQAIACEGDQKLKLYSTEVYIDGENKSLWQLALEAEQRQKVDEQKN